MKTTGDSEPSKVVLISGGARGLGLELVKHFLATGNRVASFSRKNTEQIEQLKEQYGENFFFSSVDIVDSLSVESFVKEVTGLFGDIDALVNNAGLAISGVLPLFSDNQIDALLDVNLKGTMRLTRLTSRSMLNSGKGKIINISSIVGISGYKGLSVYGATKAALDGFTRALARELGGKNITVNSVAPGFLKTEMSGELSEMHLNQIAKRTPLGRLGEARDVVNAVSFLVSDLSDFITGQVLVVDGGITS